MTIKVQIPGRVTASALVESGLDASSNGVLTFHAFSDAMKARVLELIAAGQHVVVKATTEVPRTGDWFEPAQ